MIQYFYANTIKNIVISLTDMFNDLVVKRANDSGVIVKTIPVPIKFGPVHKFQQIYQEMENTNGNYYLSLPGLAITLDNIEYATERVRGANEVRYTYDANLGIDSIDAFWTDVNPTPYNLTFTLNILTEAMDDFCQIVENILPYFNPMLSLRVKEFSFLNLERDLPVKLQSIQPEFLEPQAENEVRYVNGKITLLVEAFMYRPLTDANIIKQIQTRYYTNKNLSISGNALSSTISSNNVQTEAYHTSGYTQVSAVSSIPTSAYNYSATVGQTSAFIRSYSY